MSNFKPDRILTDTTPSCEDLTFTLLQSRTPVEKLRMTSQMTEAIVTLSLCGLRQRHPDASDSQIRFSLLKQFYGDEIDSSTLERLSEIRSEL